MWGNEGHMFVSSQHLVGEALTWSCFAKRSAAVVLYVYIALKQKQAPKTCYNFLMLARAGKYDDCLFHRLVPGFMVRVTISTLQHI